MKSIPITEFKSKCLRLIDEVNRTGEPVEITRRGKPMVRVTPAPIAADWTPGRSADTVTFVGDVESSVISEDEFSLESKWF